jgi:hypothetical protein
MNIILGKMDIKGQRFTGPQTDMARKDTHCGILKSNYKTKRQKEKNSKTIRVNHQITIKNTTTKLK